MTMLTMSTPHDELVSKFVSDGALSEEEASTLGPYEPIVEWAPHIGMFCVANVAIFHCPWCGTPLPAPCLPAAPPARPMHIFVGPDGKVDVLVDGKPAPAEVIQLLSDNDALPPGPAD